MVGQTLQSYIMAKNKLTLEEYKSDRTNPTQYNNILQDKKVYLKTLIRARQFKNILMMIREKRMIPLEIEDFNKISDQD